MRKVYFFLILLILTTGASAQFNLTLTTYSQDFAGLGTGTSTGVTGGDLSIVNASLTGWYFSESGTNNNTTITAGTGSSAIGDTYNFGSASAADRTLGGLQSGTLNPTVGFYVTNNTGSPITALAISYTGEQWRLGTLARPDRLDFQYSTNATSLSNGTWTDVDALDFTAPVTGGTIGALDGNLSTNQTAISFAIVSLNIGNSTTFFIRWNDFNATGADDGLGVDDFSFIATLGSSNTITTGIVSSPPFVLIDCSDTEIGTVAFTSTGTFNAGNTYTAQLSDDIGSFTSPTVIGNIVDNTNSGSIPITIPAGTAGGTGYRIRVISDNPSVTGSSSAAFTIIQNGFGGCSSSHSDYYRSLTTGDWTDPTTWQSSPNNTDWITATLAPTFNANTILIRAPHTVTIDGTSSADQLTIELGATLNHTNGAAFTLNDGTGTDMTIQNSGIYVLNGTQPGGAGTVSVQSGALVRVDNNSAPGESDDFAFGNGNVTFTTGCIYQWNTILTPSWLNRIYFTSGQNVKYRFSVATGTLGGNGPTTVFGHLEANANLAFQGNGPKTFVNGIVGTGNIDASAAGSGAIIIDGTTSALSVLGGGTLTLQAGVPLQLTNSTATMTSSKIITGDISFSGGKIILGNFDLTVSGSIGGYGPANYVQTDGTGYLKMNNINGTRVFPVGFSNLNALYVTTGGGSDYSVRVENGINPGVSLPTYAINRTWNIFASAITSNVQLTFWYYTADANPGVNPATDLMEVLRYSGSAWSITPGNVLITPGGANPWTVTTITPAGDLTINTTPSPFIVGKNGGWVLPIDCIINTRAQKRNNNGFISWEVNTCAEVNSFEVQRSVNGGVYQTIGTITPASPLEYNYTDASLAGGTNLYRIKVNRSSGAIKYSNTAVIINDTKGILITALSPNPVNDMAAFIITGAKAGAVSFTIYDMMGRPVRQWQSTIEEGSNTINLIAKELSPGVYHLAATMADAKTVMRFVKQ